jgi:hypothetical protein
MKIPAPIALASSLVLSIVGNHHADAQQPEKWEVQGMQVVKLEGVYRYDSGGVPLLGYIKERLAAGRVNFLVCTTAKIIPVSLASLTRITDPCPQTPGIGTGFAWVSESGKLKPVSGFPDQKTGKTVYQAIDLKDLPKEFQGFVATTKEGDWAAYSFPSEQGKINLGIIVRPDS